MLDFSNWPLAENKHFSHADFFSLMSESIWRINSFNSPEENIATTSLIHNLLNVELEERQPNLLNKVTPTHTKQSDTRTYKAML